MMRAHILWSAVLLAFSTATETAAQAAGAPAAAEIERTLFSLEDGWTQALVRRDATAFDRLLAPRFIYTENDQVMTRAQLIDALTRGADTVESARNEDMKAYVYGNTAVITGWLIVEGRGPNGAFNRRYRYTDTWVRRQGSWQVIAAHDYLAP